MTWTLFFRRPPRNRASKSILALTWGWSSRDSDFVPPEHLTETPAEESGIEITL